jgi:hypothetical protein
MRVETFDILSLSGRHWHFRIVDVGNNEILATGESYNSARARDMTAKRLSDALGAPIVKGKRR